MSKREERIQGAQPQSPFLVLGMESFIMKTEIQLYIEFVNGVYFVGEKDLLRVFKRNSNSSKLYVTTV